MDFSDRMHAIKTDRSISRTKRAGKMRAMLIADGCTEREADRQLEIVWGFQPLEISGGAEKLHFIPWKV
jgi:hypothetical protein